jgi:hypothetical protein
VHTSLEQLRPLLCHVARLRKSAAKRQATRSLARKGQEPSCPGECGLLITLKPEVESILFRPDQTAFNHRIDGDVTDPDLFHFRFPELPGEPRR